MATLTTTPIQGYAHCRDPRCAGTKQEKVDAVRTVNEYSFVDLGGDLPGVERSTSMVSFADEERDAPCPVCTEPREVTDQKRVIYPPVSGHRQDGLLHAKSFDPNAQAQAQSGNDAVLAEMMREIRELRAQVAANTAPLVTAGPAIDVLSEDEAAEQFRQERAEQIAQARRDALAKARAVKAAAKAEADAAALGDVPGEAE